MTVCLRGLGVSAACDTAGTGSVTDHSAPGTDRVACHGTSSVLPRDSGGSVMLARFFLTVLMLLAAIVVLASLVH